MPRQRRGVIIESEPWPCISARPRLTFHDLQWRTRCGDPRARLKGEIDLNSARRVQQVLNNMRPQDRRYVIEVF